MPDSHAPHALDTLRLVTLGSLSLVDADGATVVQQRRRLALLAILASARDQGVSRDRLIALLSPESSTESARHALHQLLYYIRQQAGEDIFIGTDPLRLNPQALTSDLADFEAALDEGALARAALLYRGPFLDGFHLDSIEFEEWSANARAQISARYVDALFRLASAADTAGDHSAAIEWWRRLSATDPLNGRVAIGAMKAMAAAGDTPGALRHARENAAIVRAELGVDCDPEVAAFASRLQTRSQEVRSDPPGEPAPAPPPRNDERRESSSAGPAPSSRRQELKRRLGFGTIALLAALVLAVAALAERFAFTPSAPRVTKYTQLTRTRVLFPPAVSPFPLVTDGSRLYFTEFVNLFQQPRQLAVNGGELRPISPLGEGSSVEVLGMTRDNTQLLVGEFIRGERALESPLWLWPVVGGPPRRLAEVEAHSAGYSPDGETLVFMNGTDIYLAHADGTEPRKLLTAPGRPYWPSFSPDGRRLRFTAAGGGTGGMTLWEVSIDGRNLHRLLPGWNDPPNECCGSWTSDGRLYVFQATRREGTQVWALRDGEGPTLFSRTPPAPVQLTTAPPPMNFIRPTISADGKKLFAVGWQLRGELVQFDKASGQFLAHPASLSAEWVAYAWDGKRIAYISYPEAQLFRSNADGSERLQLTFLPMRASRPQWSPDGRSIAFEAQVGNRPWRIYEVSVDGGVAHPLTKHDRVEGSPTWAPDGHRIAFSLVRNAFSSTSAPGVRILDIKSGEESELAGSGDVNEPAWSPDGRYLAAHSVDRRSLQLFDFATSKWKEIARKEFIQRLYWAADGKFIHFHTMPPAIEFYRVRVSDGHLERLGTLQGSRWVWGISWPWMGITPDGSPLYLRDQSIHHVYALDLER